MGTLFTLDDSTKSIVRDALDDLITEFGKVCRLVYPGKMTACGNCTYDNIGKKSSNHWRSGGPIPFAHGTTCPLCAGVGRHYSEVTEDITLLCEWDQKKFVSPIPGLDIRSPYSLLQTKGFLSDIPKVMRADHLILQVPIEGLVRKRFRRLGEPGDASNIVQGRYFVCLWEQSGG